MLLSKYKKKIYSLYSRKKKLGGRNNRGRITVAHQGGGHTQLYRTINFQETFEKGIVTNIEYDPNRSARIAKLYSIDKDKNIKIEENQVKVLNSNSNDIEKGRSSMDSNTEMIKLEEQKVYNTLNEPVIETLVKINYNSFY